jgi:hypothetical protein
MGLSAATQTREQVAIIFAPYGRLRRILRRIIFNDEHGPFIDNHCRLGFG